MTSIVLLPGMDGTGLLFEALLSALDETVRPVVVAYPLDQALDYLAHIEYARKILPSEGEYVLLGESFSGPIAVALAASRPVGLIGLILCASFVRNPLPLLRPLASLATVFPGAGKFAPLAAPLLFGRHATQERRTALATALAPVSGKAMGARMRAVLEADFTRQLESVRLPVLYLQASEDRVVPPSALALVKRHCPAVQVERLQGPHMLLQVCPDDAARAISQFIDVARRKARRA